MPNLLGDVDHPRAGAREFAPCGGGSDQVKGALMMTARRLTDDEVAPGSAGVGEVNAWRAAMVSNPRAWSSTAGSTTASRFALDSAAGRNALIDADV